MSDSESPENMPPLEGAVEGSSNDLEFAKNNRKYMRKKVTEFCNKLPIKIFDFTNEEISDKLIELNTLKVRLEKLDEKVQHIMWLNSADEPSYQEELDQSEVYLTKISRAVRLLRPSSISTDCSLPKNQIKLPSLPLPEYSHAESESLEEFFLKFESIVSKYAISEYEKYFLLEKQISGEPLKLIRSLNSDLQSYSEAKKLLCKAFASPICQKFEVIDRMSKLKLKNHNDVYTFISNMRTIVNSVNNLKIDVKTILQFFVWSGLTEDLKYQLISVCNTNKPSLDKIQEHIFEAAERYITVSKNRESIKGSNITGMAVNVNPDPKISGDYRNFKPCILCSVEGKSDHPIYKCNQFRTAKNKTDRLRVLKACFRCAGLNHNANNCSFKFRKNCYFCDSPNHFSYLCMNGSVKGKEGNQNNVHQMTITCNTIVNSGLSNSTILPTFSVTSSNGSIIRCLKDSGCTACFIDESVVRRDNLKVLRSIKVNINGVNGTQIYDTKLIEFKLNINNTIFTVPAIVLPQINTKLKIYGLSRIVKAFKDKGLKLADSHLSVVSDEIMDIEFILGTNFSHLLPESQVTFGKFNNCIFSNTPLGVLLMGDANGIIRNLDNIPPAVFCETSVTETDEQHNRLSRLEEMMNKMFTYVTSNKATEHSPPDDIVSRNIASSTIGCEAFMCCTTLCTIPEIDCDKILFDSDEEILEKKCGEVLNYETSEHHDDDKFDIRNKELIDITLDNIRRTESGRLEIPLLWNHKTSRFLNKNFNLACKILTSTKEKWSKSPECLQLMDAVISEQLELGIIEKITNLDSFKDSVPCSFMAHMPVFKFARDTTKCRIVYLSNLTEKKNKNVSHNTAMLSGPCLNRKLSSSLIQLRFDEKILVFDLVKAFLQIAVPDVDKQKLCFVWFKNVKKKDFNIVGYKFLRLPFGLKCSPFILMIGLYYILMVDNEKDSTELKNLKRSIWDLVYMDNGAIACNNFNELKWSYEQLNSIFNPFGFKIQQYITNDLKLAKHIATVTGEEIEPINKLFGLRWDVSDDTLFTNTLKLDKDAVTKRTILRSIAENFDIYGFNLPLLNRARLFMQRLQTDKLLGWDTEISLELSREWKNICCQIESIPDVRFPRFIGSRDDSYSLYAFTDSSKHILGVVVYIFNEQTNKMSFLLAKNRLISRNLESKSIPSLEMQGIMLGVETLIDTHSELSGPVCVNPIKINKLKLFTDSLISINWIRAHSIKFEKLNKLSVFVVNRLNKIAKLCEKVSITFEFCAGYQNPADAVTRPFSYNKLSKTCYYTGLPTAILNEMELSDNLSITVPNPDLTENCEDLCHTSVKEISDLIGYDVSRSSSFSKVLNVTYYVFLYINNLKRNIKTKNALKFANTKIDTLEEIKDKAFCNVIKRDQILNLKECVNYFYSSSTSLKDIPLLVSQLNIFKDSSGILRVKSKFRRWKEGNLNLPILLSKNSYLAQLVVREIHIKIAHAGYYSVLTELRNKFWIPCAFSFVKKIIKKCVNCKKLIARTVKLNQNVYRNFRLEHCNIPFRDVFIDYIGPFHVFDSNKVKVKRYLLIFTCLWSRAINLEICSDLSLKNFLRCFQLHIFTYGAPSRVYSDLGSQIVAGALVIEDFLKDVETKLFFKENNMNPIKFEQYYKGASKLGGLVESCVKIVKKLIYGSIRKLVLPDEDFSFIIRQVVHLSNRRPISFQDTLRDSSNEFELPLPISPEILLNGRELVSLNVVPYLQENCEDNNWTPDDDNLLTIGRNYTKLLKARTYLNKIYNEEFLPALMKQATSEKSRYLPVQHETLKEGDLVLLRETLQKRTNFPMGIVIKTNLNNLNEVTSVEVKKGTNSEVVKRHVESIIPLMVMQSKPKEKEKSEDNPIPQKRSQRSAAKSCTERIKNLSVQGII